MDRKIIRLYKNDFYKVDDFLSNNFSSPTHWKEWNLIVSKHFRTEFFYFVYYENGNIIGVCPVHRIKKKIKSRLISGPKEYLIPYGGWIFRNKTKVNSEFFKIKNNEILEIFSLPVLNEFNIEYEDLKISKYYETAIIDLKQSEDDIWKSLNQKRRNMVRKAIKNGVQICYLEKAKLTEFYDFYLKANNQYNLKNFSFGYFEDLVNTGNNINIDIIVAKKEENVFGYNIILSDKYYSIYWLGIRMKDTENNGFFDLLQWESIKKSKERNCKYYDLCYVEKECLPNIYKFKIGYSNNIYPIVNIVKKSILYRVINKVQKIAN
jgi:hypothetical protein